LEGNYWFVQYSSSEMYKSFYFQQNYKTKRVERKVWVVFFSKTSVWNSRDFSDYV